MRLEGIGTLTPNIDDWHLIYDRCGHGQMLAREGLEDLRRAARDIRRYYAQCLSCRLTARLLSRGTVRAASRSAA
jgi:hypothetical protein